MRIPGQVVPENVLENTLKSIKFKYSNHTNELQKKLQKDLKEIQEDQNVYVKADKTTNYYKTKPEDYQNLLDKNVTKSYKKASINEPDNITHTDKDIATKLNLDDRIETTARNAPFITLKDHKDDFTNKPQCRLTNPTKSEIGIISKQMLDRINKSILQSTNVNLWRSTTDTINWFKAIPDKYNHAFVTFGVCEFYPSITENLLAKALNYTSTLTSITKEERHIIIHAKESLLYHKDFPWTKRNTNDMFDVTMGSYDGAETCELIGIYMLSLIKPMLHDQIGLYRDDGLIACNAKPKQIEKIKQKSPSSSSQTI